MDFIVGTKSIDPDIMRTELFKRIEEKYKDDRHGFFKFAGGVEIGLEGNQPMKLWYFKYTGDDMCWWCPGGADQIIKNGEKIMVLMGFIWILICMKVLVIIIGY